MTTMTHPRGMRVAMTPSAPRRTAATRVRTDIVASRDSWLDRLAAWADRQPAHHRMGCWVGFR
jgi:hypothetical protein